MRHRLRFLLQELDLPPGETLIGRSPDCLVTLDDPLVSRRHARIGIRGDEAFFEDVGSRNGSRINGQKVRGPVRLSEGDRIRIGALELVYCVLPRSSLIAAQTGHLRQCAECPAIFPEELFACPSCGADARTVSESPVTGKAPDAEYDWALYLLTGLSMDALGREHKEEAERLLRLALLRMETKLVSSDPPRAAQLDALMEALLMLMGQKGGSVALLQRVLAAYARRGLLPCPTTMRPLASLAPAVLAPIAQVVDELLAAARERASERSPHESETIEKLELLRGALRGGEA